MTFGIPTDVLPITDSYEFPMTLHNEWIHHRRTVEDSRTLTRTQCATVGVPGHKDVLLGREKIAQGT